MKVYLIIIYSGRYDDAVSWVDSVWSNPIDAEKMADAIRRKYAEDAKIYPPYKENMTEQEWEEYLRLEKLREDGEAFESCDVKEYDVK